MLETLVTCLNKKRWQHTEFERKGRWQEYTVDEKYNFKKKNTFFSANFPSVSYENYCSPSSHLFVLKQSKSDTSKKIGKAFML